MLQRGYEMFSSGRSPSNHRHSVAVSPSSQTDQYNAILPDDVEYARHTKARAVYHESKIPRSPHVRALSPTNAAGLISPSLVPQGILAMAARNTQQQQQQRQRPDMAPAPFREQYPRHYHYHAGKAEPTTPKRSGGGSKSFVGVSVLDDISFTEGHAKPRLHGQETPSSPASSRCGAMLGDASFGEPASVNDTFIVDDASVDIGDACGNTKETMAILGHATERSIRRQRMIHTPGKHID
ncbi:hypothetical protein EV182_004600, partial [Spiromyces aspiralis]